MRRLAPFLLLSLGCFSACSCEDNPADLDGSTGDGDLQLPDTGIPVSDGGPGSICVGAGSPCTRAGTACCSGVCGDNELCTEVGFCKGPGVACGGGSECCTNQCVGGVCSNQLCLGIGSTCTGADQCCSGICNGTCQAVPSTGTDTCTTLGETCTSTGACCSTNCQGGVCVRAYSCQANGDVCRRNSECCGNVCSATSTSPVGRCLMIAGGGAGGCIQDGNPCGAQGGSNCCTRICVDLGSGAPVCQIAGGCRLTGDYCTDDQSCCGGGTNPNGSVICRSAPNGRCDLGNSCNPAGNICGARVLPDGGSINASQNCCDGRQEVCKLDSVGIPRCFGGCPSGNCNDTCPTGNDPDNLACCIPAGQACQFRDQCCGRAPCIPGADGRLVCAQPGACLAIGSQCSRSPDAGTAACCPGAPCQATAQAGVFACQPVVVTPDAGVAPIGDGGPPPDAGPRPDAQPMCLANGAMCTQGGAACCSGICSGGTCQQPTACQAQGGVCTSSGDCCAGLACDVMPGTTQGTCQPGAICQSAGQACSPAQACCSGLVCRQATGGAACDGTTACSCQVDL